MNILEKLQIKKQKEKEINWKIGVRNSLKKMPFRQLLIVKNMVDCEIQYRGRVRKCSK